MSLAMASAEQPLKKRKLYESVAAEPAIASPPSQEEILRKRRNREEIRNLYECYRRIRFCISKKDARLMPDFEQAYLDLITASRGCTSAQRVVAELIPRYASYCPTALEAAAKVAINMYNWSLAIITRGDDFDEVAFQTAKACIFGLVDICCTASSEAPTSSVIQGICSAVFLNVLTFFISTFEGKDIYQIDGGTIEKIQSNDKFSELKEKLVDDYDPALLKLFKFRAVCLLRIFFLCPKNLLAACFGLFNSTVPDMGVHKGANYFLRQVTSQLNADVASHQLNKTNDGPATFMDSAHLKEYSGAGEEKPDSNCNTVSEKGTLVTVNCLMGMVIGKNPSLSGWLFSRYKKLCESVGSEALSELSSYLEGVFGSFTEKVHEAASLEGSGEDESDPSKFINRHYLGPMTSNSGEISGRDITSRAHDVSVGGSFNEEGASKISGPTVKPCHLLSKLEASVSESSNHECESVESGENKDCPDRPSMRKGLVNNFTPSPAAKRPIDIRNDSFQSGNHIVQGDKNQVSANILSSPKHSSSLTSQIVWYSDGDPAAGDVFSASKQLWLGSLGHEASETLVRSQFERFGPIEQFYFFPLKGFALVDYRNIMDALKAREHMRGSAPWGSFLRIKFLDIGLGSRGAINGTAIGTSCHVYIGKVPNRWAKDEILHELVKVGLRTPRMVTDLASESALLLEFETAEEAAAVMSHIRQQRKESGGHALSSRNSVDGLASLNRHLFVRDLDHSVSDEELINAFSQFGELTGWRFIRQSGCCFIDFHSDESASVAKSHLDGRRFGPTPIRVEFRTSSSGNVPSNTIGSPYFPLLDNPTDCSKNRISQLSSLFVSLCAKYNLRHSSSSLDIHISRDYQSDATPTSTLWIGLPDFASHFFTDDDIMSICNVAVGNIGSVSRLTRTNTPRARGSCWFVDFNSVDAAITVLKNIRGCPGMFFQIEYRNSGIPPHTDEPKFLGGKTNASGYLLSHDNSGSSGFGSQPRNHNISPFIMKSEGGIHELVSPRVSVDNHGMPVQSGLPFQSNWPVLTSMERPEVVENVEEKVDRIENNMASNLQLQEGQAISRTTEQTWMYKKPEIEMQMSAPGTMHCPPNVTQAPSLVPPPIQPPSFLRPVYLTPNNSWDMRGPNPPLPLNHIPPGMATSFHVNVCSTSFLHSPVTPVAQMPGNAVQHFDQMLTLPTVPPLSSPPPPPPDMPPPLPPSPPPLPLSQPPSVPPPPSSPPPLQQAVEYSNLQASGHRLQYQWQGVLCKSGVQYCTIIAYREEAGACKYANAMPEPAEWPEKLDVTKRTDFRHVMSTFSSTPPNKREVCRLLPSSAVDHKGKSKIIVPTDPVASLLQDFIMYLNQRECAGVIKIPAGKSIWARLLFILPYSPDTCSMLGIAPHPVECLIGLILPKEKNFEWVQEPCGKEWKYHMKAYTSLIKNIQYTHDADQRSIIAQRVTTDNT